jgi:small conductance mechanosensitive channel
MTLVSIAFEAHIFSEDAVFNKDISSNNLINGAFRSIPYVFTTCQIFFIAAVSYSLMKRIMLRVICRNSSKETAARLLISFMKYLITVIAVMTVLTVWGIDTTTIVASAGIVSLIIGLGAQSLIADILAGMFIVFEQEYKVGDVVIIGEWKGTVLDIGIRSTRIVDIGGNVMTINNSSITKVINQNQPLSVAEAIVGIDYAEPLVNAELVLRDNISRIRGNVPDIIEGPFYKGVDELAGSSVNLLLYARCREDDVRDVERGMLRQIKLIFDENGIPIAFPQVVVNRPVSLDKDIDDRQNKMADEFVDNQRRESKGVEKEI